MDDVFKSDFPTGVFLTVGLITIILGILLGVFIIGPAAGTSVMVVFIVVLAVIGCAFFYMYYLTSGTKSKYVLKRYGQSIKMIRRTDLVRQAETSSRFSEAAAKKKESEEER